MTTFTERTHSPHRHAVVGSFLRPEELKEARQKFADGEISREELTVVEDKAIIDLIQKQEAAGLKVVTDGELRRSWWHLDFYWGLNGVERVTAIPGYDFEHVTTRGETARIVGKISGEKHTFVEHFKFVRDHAADDVEVKQTIPSPSQFLIEFLHEDNRKAAQEHYDSLEEVYKDLQSAYLTVINDLREAGCHTIQLDDCSWDQFFGPNEDELPEEERAERNKWKNEFVKLNNAVIQNVPSAVVVNTHVCRGNYTSTWFASGGYENVEEPLFTAEDVDSFFLEYDSERSGGFEPLASVPDDKLVVLGLITSKSGELEDRHTVIQRIQEASEYHPLENLCLSPQCGFASTEEGNKLTEKQQWGKIALIKSISEEVWGN